MMIRIILITISTFLFNTLQAQVFWGKVSANRSAESYNKADSVSSDYILMELNRDNLDKYLDKFDKQVELKSGSKTTIELPLPDGTVSSFRIEKDHLIPDALQNKFPDVKTYKGYGIDDPSAYLRFSRTELGYDFNIQSVEHPKAHIIVNDLKSNTYQCLYKKDAIIPESLKHFKCSSGNHIHHSAEKIKPKGTQRKSKNPNTLTTYRLALACNGQYTAFHGGTAAKAFAAMVQTISNVTGYFEWEMSISFTLVPDNDKLIYTDAATDPYDDANIIAMIEENRINIPAVIGVENFDIGHLLGSQNMGGLAYVGAICTSHKSGAVTSIPAASSSLFDIDFLGHEIGHQFSANHTFYNSCYGNRNEPTAVEPGSGTTTMSYAGLCAPNIVSAHSKDDYFHGVSIAEMKNFVMDGYGSYCGTTDDLGNNMPTVSAGQDYYIPASTPFFLKATASDINEDALTYSWEQVNTGGDYIMPPAANNPSGPLFRSRPPSNNNIRYLPNRSALSANTETIWEVLPSRARTMDFLVTVRDNHAGNGLIAQDDMQVTTVNDTGPFEVSPLVNTNWLGGSKQTISWNVAKTDKAPINCQTIDLMLSDDDGMTFAYTLVKNTPNDGSQEITIPNIDGNKVKVAVMATNNIFYAISNESINVESVIIESEGGESSEGGIVVSCSDLSPVITATPSIVSGMTNLNLTIKINEINNVNTEGIIRVYVPVDPRITFDYDSNLTTVGFSTVNNNKWTYQGNNGLFHTFQTEEMISASGYSTIGLIAMFNPQNGEGKTTITTTIKPYDGGDCKVNNNSDSEFIDFFK